ncbi:uncharacterized protein LOC128883397 [Hylaeus volcanicus]|uniref:uncharacterized protein LOC128883397 n=1 Tax=Hylaeus volcanicus TaxID=313075 RepID=UPI0023B784B7|nr:uncharacterized protein LOC128883397 [Hylaeus volcanicus]
MLKEKEKLLCYDNVSELEELWNEFHKTEYIQDTLKCLETNHQVYENDTLYKIQKNVKDHVQTSQKELLDQTYQMFPQFFRLIKEIENLEWTLTKTEHELNFLKEDLTKITDNIQNFQITADSLEVSQENRMILENNLKTYIGQVLIIPLFKKQLLEDPLDSNFLYLLNDLRKKKEQCLQKTISEYPSVQESKDEISQLEKHIKKRLHLFFQSFLEKMNPSSLQKTQNNFNPLTLYLKYLFFLTKHYPQMVEDIQKDYITSRCSLYLKMFENYIQDLTDVLQCQPSSVSFLMGQLETSSDTFSFRASAQEAMKKIISLSPVAVQELQDPSVSITTKQALTNDNRDSILVSLSLGHRDHILSTSENPLFLQKKFSQLFSHTSVSESCENPEIKQTLNDTACNLSPRINKKASPEKKDCIMNDAYNLHYPEVFFWSHQKLLTSTIECEYAFSKKFFFYDPLYVQSLFTEKEFASLHTTNNKEAVIPDSTSSVNMAPPNIILIQEMLQTIFQPTLKILLHQVSLTILKCYDGIGLCLMILINDINRTTILYDLQQYFENYFDSLDAMLWSQLSVNLKNHVESVKTFDIQDSLKKLPIPLQHQCHFISKRYALFTAALRYLNGVAIKKKLRCMHRIESFLKQLDDILLNFLHIGSRFFLGQRHTTENISNQCTFQLNNILGIEEIYRQQHVAVETLSKLQIIKTETIKLYITTQLEINLLPVVTFLRNHPHLTVTASNVSTVPVSPPSSDLSQLSLNDLRDVVLYFNSNWLNALKLIHARVFGHLEDKVEAWKLFTQVFTDILVDYSKLFKLVYSVYPSHVERQAIPWIRNMKPMDVMAYELKKFSTTFQ